VPRLRPPPDYGLRDLAASQALAVSRAQALAAGMSSDQIRRLLSVVWQRSAYAGVYVAATGPVDYVTRYWAALLHAGPGSALGMETAGWFWELQDEAPEMVHVMVAGDRRPARQDGTRFHIRVHLAERVHPARLPALVTLEDTVLDLVDRPSTTESAVVGLVLRACRRRLTTPQRLAEGLARRPKIRHRGLVSGLLTEATDGVQSALEHRYLRDVERAHGLPRGQRNRVEVLAGARRYRDVRYLPYLTCVELDGAAAHPAELHELDDLRDNALLVADGTRTVRYGWRSVTALACETAAQVRQLLVLGGWAGSPTRCGPGCRLPG
jgi:hypothetical protein